MKTLRNLQQIYSLAAGKFNQYDGHDFVLPSVFKELVKDINGYSIIYNEYSAIIQTKNSQRGFLNIFLPNQWFYIASYFIDFYKELVLYKEYALKVATKERLKGLNGQTLTDDEQKSLSSLDLDDTSKSNLQRFITDYDWWHGAKSIDRGDFYVSPILSCACLVNASQSYVVNLCEFLAEKQDLAKSIIEGVEDESKSQNNVPMSRRPLQQITYGAPGTGKSHGINTLLKTTNHVRTTFHPDSDYASFVGAYKPTMVKQEKRSSYDVLDNDNKHEEEEIIAYKFVPQAFIKAYVSAWKNYPKETVLVIEEINRGNCAQIFGDLFQLLDRKDNGFSSYPIDADADIAQYLCSELKDILPNEGDVSEINNVFSENYPDGIVEQIKNGTKLLLPNNLYIWATMNTSDQSLFPIDSAFKRRWDWKFVKISDAHKNWTIHFGDEACSWWEFIKKMNKIIAKETSSDDKKLGYFFCKPSNEDEDFINEERFVGKVLFYLWNDVFKDGETKYFEVSDDPEDEPTFEAFYNDDCTPCVAAIRKFIVGIVGEENVHSTDKTEQPSKEEKHDEDNKSTWSEADKSRYEFWEQFLNYANGKSEDFAKYFSGVKTPSKDHWKNFTIPNVDFYLGALQLRQKKQAKVEVYFDETTETYHKLFAHKAEIEKEMGVTYEWRENPDKKASVIEEILPNIDFDNKEKWTDVFDFFIDRLLRMREVFLKYAQMS